MRIDRPPLQELGAARERKAAGPSPATSSASGADPTAGTGVVVARTVAEVTASTGRAQADATDRVAALRAAVAEGRYQVDVPRLAERLVADELARGGSRR